MNYVNWYDNKRLHNQLVNGTPEEYEQANYAATTGSLSRDVANKKAAGLPGRFRNPPPW